MKDKLIIAIDGPAGSGKSTVAKRLAERLNYSYIDSGAMYRAVTWKAMSNGINPTDKDSIAELAHKMEITFKENGRRIFVDGEDVSSFIRTPEVSRNVALVADNIKVREELVNKQRILSKDRPVVMDGRDIATVVFPDAHLKIYLDASLSERARRRYNDFIQQKKKMPLEKVYEETRIRDILDKKRPVGALIRDKDAVYIDSTGMSIDEVASKILELVCELRISVVR